MAATPLETFFMTTGDTASDWIQLVVPWPELERAAWADAEGRAELDLTLIVGYGFGLGLEESHPDGVLWVDDIRLATGQPEPQAVVEPTVAAEAPSAVAAEPTLAPETALAAEPTLLPEPTQAPVEAPTVADEPPASGVRAVFPEATAAVQETSGRGICSAAAMLPLGVAAVVLARRRRD